MGDTNQPAPGPTGQASTTPSPNGTPTPGPTGQAPTVPPPSSTPGATPLPSPTPNPKPQGAYGRPDLLVSLNPAAPDSDGYRVTPQLLRPAESAATQTTGEVQQVGRDVSNIRLTPTPGFQTAFQVAHLNEEWAAEISAIAQAIQACGDKIRRTREAYEQAEAAATIRPN